MTLPRVIALTPAWNAEAFIDRTLDALAMQTYANFKILISDDGSSDRTAELCAERAAHDPRFELICQPENLGWVGNTNALLERGVAQADYLLFAFHDDVLEPTYVEALVDRLESKPGAVMAYSDVSLHYASGEREEAVFDLLDGNETPLQRTMTMVWQRGDWWVPNRGLFRASAAAEIDGLKRHKRGEFSADWPWLVALACRGGFERVPGFLCSKFYMTSSLSRSWSFDARAYRAVTASVRRELLASDLSWKSKMVLQLALLRRYIWWLRNGGDRRVAART